MILDVLIVAWVCVGVGAVTVAISSLRLEIHRSFAAGSAMVTAVSAVHLWPSRALLLVTGIALATSVFGLACLIERRSTRTDVDARSHRGP